MAAFRHQPTVRTERYQASLPAEWACCVCGVSYLGAVTNPTVKVPPELSHATALLIAQSWVDPVHITTGQGVTGDQIDLLRVTPSIKTINDPSAYEFYGGRDKDGKPVWTRDFENVKPLLRGKSS